MTIASEKGLLTTPNSKLTKLDPLDLAAALASPQAWDTLPLAARQHLYSLLPSPREGQPPHDVDVNPMDTEARPYIEIAVGKWQEGVRDGRETRKWRETAVEAGRLRREGVLEGLLGREREERDGEGDGKEGGDGDGKDSEVQGSAE